MPALKLLIRRTLATATLTPSSVLPSAPHRRRLHSLKPPSLFFRKGCAGLGLSVAHVKIPTKQKQQNVVGGVIMVNKKRVFNLTSTIAFCSSSSSSSAFVERENNTNSRKDCLVAEMGHEPNGVVEDDEEGKKGYSSKLLTLPTVLTLARVAAIPVFIGTFYVNNWWGTTATTSIFIAAAITDWLDGYLARKMGLGTAFGAFLDPVADKLMVAATLVLLCSRPPETAILGDAPWLFPVAAIAIIGREITMSAVREWAASQNTKLLQAVAVNNLGKWKTATQMTALTLLLATRDSSLADTGTLGAIGVALLYISAGLAVWSLVVYMRKIWNVLLK